MNLSLFHGKRQVLPKIDPLHKQDIEDRDYWRGKVQEMARTNIALNQAVSNARAYLARDMNDPKAKIAILAMLDEALQNGSIKSIKYEGAGPPDHIPNKAEQEDFGWAGCSCGENVCVNMYGMGTCKRCGAKLPPPAGNVLPSYFGPV